jgi:hypothetical protein
VARLAGHRFADERGRLPAVGAPVEVLQHYNERWTGGFEVARIDWSGAEPAVALRRRSDGSVLPTTFNLRDVRTT